MGQTSTRLLSTNAHWESLFKRRLSNELSWYQPHLRISMRLIARAGVSAKSKIIDVGGGDSTLVDDLLGEGAEEVTILDISAEALARARQRLGETGDSVRWIQADVTEVQLPSSYYDVWHDRALFHFLTNPAARGAYTALLGHALRPRGYVIVATFAPDGPQECSRLPTMRYSPEWLLRELGPRFKLVGAEHESHRTPSTVEQRFVYSLFQRRAEHNSA